MKNDVKIKAIIKILSRLELQARIKANFDNEPSKWERTIIYPTVGYIEPIGYGPVSVKNQLEWIEIDPIKQEYIGRLVPERKIDRRLDLINELRQIEVVFSELNGKLRIERNSLLDLI